MQGITIVGPGRMGGALAYALSRSGYRIEALIYRGRRDVKRIASELKPTPELQSIDRVSKINSKIIFITTQDEETTRIPVTLAGNVSASAIVFHTSGSLSSEVLAPFREKGCACASLHPLASISAWNDGSERFRGAYFCLEGHPKAVRVGHKIVKSLEGHSFTIDTANKPLYHAAALTAAGHVTALFDVAVGLMAKAGLSRKQARTVLQPLLDGVARNLATHDAPAALTGTFARGDQGTLERHLEALEQNASKDELLIYLDLSLWSLKLAERRGFDLKRIEEMRRTILMAKHRLG